MQWSNVALHAHEKSSGDPLALGRPNPNKIQTREICNKKTIIMMKKSILFTLFSTGTLLVYRIESLPRKSNSTT